MTCDSHPPERKRIVTLMDGREVCSCSREWAHECEARLIYTRPTVEERRAMLDQIQAKRGKAARVRLEETLMEMHQGARRARTGK